MKPACLTRRRQQSSYKETLGSTRDAGQVSQAEPPTATSQVRGAALTGVSRWTRPVMIPARGRRAGRRHRPTIARGQRRKLYFDGRRRPASRELLDRQSTSSRNVTCPCIKATTSGAPSTTANHVHQPGLNNRCATPTAGFAAPSKQTGRVLPMEVDRAPLCGARHRFSG